MKRVSVGVGGIEGNGRSVAPWISEDGRFVAFDSQADNLVSGDTGLRSDMFVVNVQTGMIERVTKSKGSGLFSAARDKSMSPDPFDFPFDFHQQRQDIRKQSPLMFGHQLHKSLRITR